MTDIMTINANIQASREMAKRLKAIEFYVSNPKRSGSSKPS
jgi:hypothetical protein